MKYKVNYTVGAGTVPSPAPSHVVGTPIGTPTKHKPWLLNNYEVKPNDI